MLYDKQVGLAPISNNPDVPPRGMSESVQRLIEERVGLGFWELEPMGRIVKLSGQAARIMNVPTTTTDMRIDEFVGCFVPADRKKLAVAMNNISDKMEAFEGTLRLYFNGDIKVVEIFCDVARSEKGGIKSIVGSLRDITRRAKDEATSNGRAAILRVVMKNIPSAVAVMDTRMNFLSVSDHWVIGHGFKSANDFLGKPIYDVFPHSSKFKGDHVKALAGHIVRGQRDFIKDSQGNIIKQEVVICPWKTSTGKVGGVILMMGQVDEKVIEENKVSWVESKDSLLELLEEVS